jgi:hemolysin III
MTPQADWTPISLLPDQAALDFFHLREPISAWTHCVGLVLALPGTLLLWRQSQGSHPSKRLSLLIFGFSLAFCYASSTLYHSLRLPDEGLAALNRLDRIGIFTLIAGTYTPLAYGILRGWWRWGTLCGVWFIAAVSSIQLATGGPFPPLLSTGLYLALGWASVACYAKLARAVPHRSLRPLVAGGVFYSLGAVFNTIRWPVLLPGLFGAHELFHLFVMAGSLAHYRLILGVVVPFEHKTDTVALETSPARSFQPGTWRS